MTNQIQISMNYKNILIRLHNKFPQFDTDTLIEILNCIDEDNLIPTLPPIPISNPGISWTNDLTGIKYHVNDNTTAINKAEALN